MKRIRSVAGIAFATVVLIAALAVPALAVPGRDDTGRLKDPDRVNPLAAAALQQGEKKGKPNFTHGRIRPNNQRFDNVLTLLVEFAGDDEITDPDGTVRSTTGPLHNEIAAPGVDDNTSFWVPDFSVAHYQKMLFDKSPKAKSMFTYYLAQSGGAYAVDGRVYGWVQVPHSEAFYGVNDAEDNDSDPARLVADAVAAAGNSIPWAQFDKEDPYDLDGDGVTTEPDGYVDHIQLVHAGAGEEAGGGAQGTDAIWSHSWWVPPSFGEPYPGLGGAPTGDPNVWVGPYTMNPEDGTLGVFVHEFAHDIGLPDLYDTIYSGESSTGFWTLMSSGSWLSVPGEPLGVTPSDLGIWEKYVLGWVDPMQVYPGEKKRTYTLKPAESKGSSSKVIRVNLPGYELPFQINVPSQGALEWYSGKGDGLNNTLVRSLAIPAGGATLDFQTWYDIEEGWDYGSVEVSVDGGATWTSLPGSITTTDNPYGQNPGNGITGVSGGDPIVGPVWVPATFDLPYGGMTVMLRFRYWTDGYVQGEGWTWDELTVTADDGSVIFADDAESADPGWTATGWTRTEGSGIRDIFHYYLAEWREPIGFDASMNNWYNIIDGNTAEFFRANPGMLLWYRSNKFEENWVGEHPWEGFVQVVDSQPGRIPAVGSEAVSSSYFGADEGLPARTRINLADATFGRGTTLGGVLTSWGYGIYPVTMTLPTVPQVPTFDDSVRYVDDFWAPWFADPMGWLLTRSINSTDTPTYGVKITVNSSIANNGGGRVTVDFSRPLATPIIP